MRVKWFVLALGFATPGMARQALGWTEVFQSSPARFTFPADASPGLQAVRVTVNARIRSSREFGGVIYLEAAVRDPADPQSYRKDCDSGDHLHPNRTGYAAMGDAIALRLFR